MGYESHVEGEIAFSRQLNGRDTRELRQHVSALNCSYFLQPDVITQEIKTDEGILTRIQCQGLVAPGKTGKARDLEKDLAAIILTLPRDVTCAGYIERIGEDFPDAERLHVIGRRVISVKPSITWPDPK